MHLRPCLALALSSALLAPVPALSQHPEPEAGVVEGEDFRVYDGRGRSRSFAEILAAMDRADAVLVGETHDDAVGHRVEAQLLIRAAQRFGVVGDQAVAERPVVLSLEMFERDVQYILDEYLADLITEDQFKRSARPWDRYDSDYRPLVEFARAHGIDVVAANAPRRYVNRVTRLGPGALGELPAESLRHLPPLPYPGPSERYTAQWNRLMTEMMEEMRAARDSARAEQDPGPQMPEGPAEPVEPTAPDEEAQSAPPDHGMGYALQAQALWDAAMGHAVTRALADAPGALVLHYAGSFHVQSGTGIPERVPEYRPGSRVLTVVLEPAESIDGWDEEEHEGLADFVVLTRKPADEEASGSPP